MYIGIIADLISAYWNYCGSNECVLELLQISSMFIGIIADLINTYWNYCRPIATERVRKSDGGTGHDVFDE